MTLSFFLSTDTATPQIYTLSLHDALPISIRKALPVAELRNHDRGRAHGRSGEADRHHRRQPAALDRRKAGAARNLRSRRDRKSTRLNSSHANISYAVFCLKKKKR